MVELNWTIIIYFVIGLFALSGFFKGWWKEAITTFFLGILVFFLQFPNVAQWVIERFNDGLRFLWEWLPLLFKDFFGIEIAPQLEASHGGTWLVILIVFLALAILIGRAWLPNRIRRAGYYYTYAVTPIGSFFGGLLGGLNGFLIINLVREYLTGSNLPLGEQPTTEIAMSAEESVRLASSGVAIALTELPRFTVLNNLLAWIVIGFGLLIALMALRTRTTIKRLRVADYKRPWGYQRYVIELPPPPKT